MLRRRPRRKRQRTKAAEHKSGSALNGHRRFDECGGGGGLRMAASMDCSQWAAPSCDAPRSEFIGVNRRPRKSGSHGSPRREISSTHLHIPCHFGVTPNAPMRRWCRDLHANQRPPCPHRRWQRGQHRPRCPHHSPRRLHGRPRCPHHSPPACTAARAVRTTARTVPLAFSKNCHYETNPNYAANKRVCRQGEPIQPKSQRRRVHASGQTTGIQRPPHGRLPTYSSAIPPP